MLSTQAASLEDRKRIAHCKWWTGVQKSIQILRYPTYSTSSVQWKDEWKFLGYLLAQPCLKVSATKLSFFTLQCFSALATWNHAPPQGPRRRRDVIICWVSCIPHARCPSTKFSLKRNAVSRFFCDTTPVSHTFLVFEKSFRTCRPRYIFKKNWFKECQDVLLLTEIFMSNLPFIKVNIQNLFDRNTILYITTLY
jgi:hypothetical protein